MLTRRTMLFGLAGATLAPALPSIAGAQARGSLQDGSIVSLRCLGHIRTANQFLDGRTTSATVGLSPERGGGYSGALWRVHFVEQDVVAFNCQGHIEGPRWLDGRTTNGTVGLAPRTTGGYSGTFWRLHEAGEPGVIGLECLGHLPGKRWLDGRTVDGTVGLAPGTGGGFTGTRWFVEYA
ncbi:hypothetical protein GJW-30_1_01429 [Variibacter gotjawalensis]|uniref:Uncharacterized protein n=1 Tax=Variibacter gotjawalensis TaxID=1333996 RepID=A0A0S3PSH3_9BRAD|nr:hypothetical protein [Variibacter gotjawalensis]NIK49214.1 hypothetical protein [Variibacter gotjawalensis]RZS51067.1 hypothetical protein EV661_3540 [Variibacter gotjawalensis]BAT58901.1 hypothetical protein GJW-30_1_01429 [Variibacter gotjawalensis]